MRNRKGSAGEVTLARRPDPEFVHQRKAEMAFQAEDTAPSKCHAAMLLWGSCLSFLT